MPVWKGSEALQETWQPLFPLFQTEMFHQQTGTLAESEWEVASEYNMEQGGGKQLLPGILSCLLGRKAIVLQDSFTCTEPNKSPYFVTRLPEKAGSRKPIQHQRLLQKLCPTAV